MTSTRAFDEIHVISDLHLGGTGDRQIFASPELLEAVVDRLAARPSGRRTALVINGDFVDFLAEQRVRSFDPSGALDRLEQTASSEGPFARVWKALRAFVAAEDRRLFVNAGNHDLELGIPAVRERLRTLLAGDLAIHRGRVEVVADGTGVALTAGPASVLCVHGNEVDDWNVADYEHVRHIARELQYDNSVGEWIPNAGSRLVVDVMNDLKREYAFVDLLKPELAAVIPTLVALDPRVVRKVPRLLPIAGRKLWDRLRMAAGFLGTDGEAAEPPPAVEAPPRVQVSDRARRELADAQVARLLDEAERRIAAGDSAMQALDAVGRDGDLGHASAILEAARIDRVEALRLALARLARDRSFDLTCPDDTFHALDAWVSPRVAFLVAGHTHLRRALTRPGGGAYYNTGTWARLMHLTPEVLGDRHAFAALYGRLAQGSLAALEAPPSVVERQPTVASICIEDGEVVGTLNEALPGGALNPLPGTRFPRS